MLHLEECSPTVLPELHYDCIFDTFQDCTFLDNNDVAIVIAIATVLLLLLPTSCSVYHVPLPLLLLYQLMGTGNQVITK